MLSIESEILATMEDLDTLQKQHDNTVDLAFSLKSSLRRETLKREAAETTIADLEKEKQRCLNHQFSSYEQAVQQLDYASKYANAMRSLTEMKEKMASYTEEQEAKVATLCATHEAKEEQLRKQIMELNKDAASNEDAVACLEMLLAESISPESFRQKIQEAEQNLHDKYRDELEVLREKLKREELNNQNLQVDVQEAQHSLMSSKLKHEEQLRELSTNRHAHVFKQKMMKLRQDNDSLRRQLQNTLDK